MQLDWNDVRFFLAVARTGTLAKAALQMQVDQTTVGRRIGSLESKLGVALFARASTGFALTAAGRRVRDAAERMEEAARELGPSAAAGSLDQSVRVATTESLAESFVVPAVRAMRRAHPRVGVIVATSWARVDLRKGEADLAVRLMRSTDPRLANRRLAEYTLRLYASRSYVDETGMPDTLDGRSLIAYEDAVRTDARHPFAGLAYDRANLALLSNSHHTLLAGALAGVGIVQLPSYVGDSHTQLVRVFPEIEERYSVWLVVPQANRRLAAVRAVSDAIARAFRAIKPARTSRGRS
jgi:DNA-binding transcriptional LysR family regulator